MTIARRRSPVCFALTAIICVPLAACGDDDGPAGTADTGVTMGDTEPPSPDAAPADLGHDARSEIDMGGVPDAAFDGGMPRPTIVLRGTIRDFLSDAPVSGLSVCIYEEPELPCATTVADGTFELEGVPAFSDLRLTYQGSDERWQRSMLHIRTLGVDQMWGLTTIDALVAEGLATDAGITLDPTRATVVFTTVDGEDPPKGVAGLGASIEPDDAEALAFITDTFTVSTSQTATGTRGVGFFANVPPGPHTLRFTHPDRSCMNTAGWQGSSPTEARVDVVAGWFSSTPSMLCPP